MSGTNFHTARSVDLCNFKGTDLTYARLDNVDFRKTNITTEQLLSAGSIVNINIEKSNFTKEELSHIKIKMIQDYKIAFKILSFEELVNLLGDIVRDEKHVLKIQRDFSLNEYGLTASYSDVMNFGRKQLLKLSEEPSFNPPQANNETYNNLCSIFKAPIYSWHAKSFWGKEDNASEALNSILGYGDNVSGYQFTPRAGK